ncbi:MAG: peptidylprolyl isomerase [Firmicutes bacterium]|nr:peptidylprolyl isomerase [Bacillota bacterium]
MGKCRSDVHARARRLPAILLAAAALAGAACRSQAPPGPDVWAVVNGKEIRREEVEKLYRSQLALDQPPPPHEQALSMKLAILDELINNEILLERARKLGMEATDGEVEDKFIEMKAPYTEEEFQRQLRERELTVEDLKRDLRRQLTVQKVFNREVFSRVSVTDQEIAEFYEQNREQFNVREPQYRIAQIVVTPRPDPGLRNRKGDDATTDAEARRKAASLLQQIQAGADFNQLAMDYSEDPTTASTGGDLGYIPDSALNNTDPAVKRIITGMRPGEVSNVVSMGGTYRIFKMIAREVAGQRQLEDVRTKEFIRDTLRNRKEQLLRAAFLTIAREEARITNYLARQVLESAGKLPASGSPAPATGAPAGSTPSAAPPSQPQP